MTTLLRTDSNHSDFRQLVSMLDKYLAVTDGDEHAFYDQYNKLDTINEVIVAYVDGKPAGCGAVKKFSDLELEIKRMFVAPEFRNLGIAKSILNELENWAGELGFPNCILETGVKQFEAIQLYQKCGYTITENYGQYFGVANSICMKKIIE